MKGGYHIRLSVTKPPSPASASTSSSYQRSHLDSTTAFVPSSLFQQLPAHPPKITARRYTFHHSRDKTATSEASEGVLERRDYRFGPLRVDWVDFDDMDLRSGAQKDKRISHKGLCRHLSSLYSGCCNIRTIILSLYEQRLGG